MGFICESLTARHMTIDPESFDEPVKDYNFQELSDPKSLIDQMATAGGFTATKLAYARDILKDMKSEIDFALCPPRLVCV